MNKISAKERIAQSEIHLIYAVSMLQLMENTLHSSGSAGREDQFVALVVSTLEQVKAVQRKLDVL